MPRARKIAKLPAELRQWLERAFVEHAFGDISHITELLNTELKARGIPLEIGRSAVGEESLRLKRAQESIAATTRAMQLIADTATDVADKRGEALNALVQEGLFEALITAREAEQEPDPGKRIALMNKAALASARLSLSNIKQRRYRAEVEKAARDVADKVGRLARQGGLTSGQVRAIREQILGIPKALGRADDTAGQADAPTEPDAPPAAVPAPKHGHAQRAVA